MSGRPAEGAYFRKQANKGAATWRKSLLKEFSKLKLQYPNLPDRELWETVLLRNGFEQRRQSYLKRANELKTERTNVRGVNTASQDQRDAIENEIEADEKVWKQIRTGLRGAKEHEKKTISDEAIGIVNDRLASLKQLKKELGSAWNYMDKSRGQRKRAEPGDSNRRMKKPPAPVENPIVDLTSQPLDEKIPRPDEPLPEGKHPRKRKQIPEPTPQSQELSLGLPSQEFGNATDLWQQYPNLDKRGSQDMPNPPTPVDPGINEEPPMREPRPENILPPPNSLNRPSDEQAVDDNNLFRPAGEVRSQRPIIRKKRKQAPDPRLIRDANQNQVPQGPETEVKTEIKDPALVPMNRALNPQQNIRPDEGVQPQPVNADQMLDDAFEGIDPGAGLHEQRSGNFLPVDTIANSKYDREMAVSFNEDAFFNEVKDVPNPQRAVPARAMQRVTGMPHNLGQPDQGGASREEKKSSSNDSELLKFAKAQLKWEKSQMSYMKHMRAKEAVMNSRTRYQIDQYLAGNSMVPAKNRELMILHKIPPKLASALQKPKFAAKDTLFMYSFYPYGGSERQTDRRAYEYSRVTGEYRRPPAGWRADIEQ